MGGQVGLKVNPLKITIVLFTNRREIGPWACVHGFMVQLALSNQVNDLRVILD